MSQNSTSTPVTTIRPPARGCATSVMRSVASSPRRAHEMERQGYEIVSLNIGNPGAFGFRTPEILRLAMIENLANSEGYSHQKGIFPAREAIVMHQQARWRAGCDSR